MSRIRHAADWSLFWSINGKLFGVIAAAVTIIAAVVPNLTAIRFPLVIGIIAAMILSAWFSFSRSKVSKDAVWVAPAGDGRVRLRIRKGDLFDPLDVTSKVTVITMNRRFGLTTVDVKDESLITQVASIFGDKDALAKSAPEVPFDWPTDLPMGTIYRVSAPDHDFVLLGMVQLPAAGAEASELPVGDLWQALAHLWKWGRAHRADLRIPVIGSGRSGSTLGHELLMALIALSLVTFLRDHNSPSRETEIEMVISDGDWEPERINQLNRLLTDLKFKRKR